MISISAEIYFFEGRQDRHSCFRKDNFTNHSERSVDKNAQNADMVKEDESDTEFSAAVKSTMNSRIRNGSDVNFVAIRNGKVRLRP